MANEVTLVMTSGYHPLFVVFALIACLQSWTLWICFNTLRMRQNGRHFTDNILKYIFLNENAWWISIIKFHWSLCPGVQSIIFQHWCRWWVDTGHSTSHYLNKWWLVNWHLFESLRHNELAAGLWFGHHQANFTSTNVHQHNMADE